MRDNRWLPCLTPHGRLTLAPSDDAFDLEPESAERLGQAFARGSGYALLHLATSEMGRPLPPAFAYWREFGARYVTAFCVGTDPDGGNVEISRPSEKEFEAAAAAAPAMPGAEYLTPATLSAFWDETAAAFASELSRSGLPPQDFLKKLNPVWNIVGRVHFNLAENPKDGDFPFAFLATYTHKITAHGRAQHLPLGQALREYAGAGNRERLLSLLVPVQRAAERLDWLKAMVDKGGIFHPLRWSPQDAFRFLKAMPAIESSGVVVRMPAAWKFNRPSRPSVTATVGEKAPIGFGKDALLDFNLAVTLDGESLSPAEIMALLAQSSGLTLLRGQWVEIDRDRLGEMMERFRKAEKLAKTEGLTFAESMRLLSGAGIVKDEPAERADPDWSNVVAGAWLKDTLRDLRSPQGLAQVAPGNGLRGELRPYQQVGVRWLNLLSRLGLGACLADDMGLGKSVQVLSLLLVQRQTADAERDRSPSLLVAPASLLANWTAEIEKFAPDLKVLVAHPSTTPPRNLKAIKAQKLSGLDLVITSYGTLPRLPWMTATHWRLAILDEAQAIKNPNTGQTRAVKALNARARIALTGTPIENRLGDLWSIFDFANPGLLGTGKQFNDYVKGLAEREHNPYGPLRDLVRPYILRRLKTDKTVISDLPAKSEVKAYCRLSRKQAALYEQAVREFADLLKTAKGMQRKGLVFAYLMRLKQICNHPSQWLGDGAWTPSDSGKMDRLRELCEIIAAKQDKALIFTQFQETTEPLADFLGGVFGRPGLVLHGGTPLKRRKELVQRFQEDESTPFFVLSLKAGGTGLNLTAASHVVHFDRWWNPAVENQATDRAFRIGQSKNVLVHKFVCRGTVEERIDALIESKKKLSQDLLEGGSEINLTEMKDEDLLRLVALNLDSAAAE
jgi:non-specific serine/threonine protein kinase